MRDFWNFCHEQKLELPVNPEHDPKTDWEEVDAQDVKTEQRARTGWSANYPPAYFSAQYPNLWMGSRKSTHALDGKHMGRTKK